MFRGLSCRLTCSGLLLWLFQEVRHPESEVGLSIAGARQLKLKLKSWMRLQDFVSTGEIRFGGLVRCTVDFEHGSVQRTGGASDSTLRAPAREREREGELTSWPNFQKVLRALVARGRFLKPPREEGETERERARSGRLATGSKSAEAAHSSLMKLEVPTLWE